MWAGTSFVGFGQYLSNAFGFGEFFASLCLAYGARTTNQTLSSDRRSNTHHTPRVTSNHNQQKLSVKEHASSLQRKPFFFATGFALRLGSAPTSVVAAGQLSEQAARRDPSIVKELCDTLDQMNAPDEGTHESLHCTQCCIGATTNYSVS